MRSSRVSSPLRNTQALNGLMVGPAVRSTPNTSSPTRLRSPTTAPPTQRPWPSRYLVAEWTTMSAPSASGCCSAGVQKQLSTTSRQSWARARAARARISRHFGQRVGGGLQEQQPGFGADGRFPLRQVGERHEAGAHTEFGQVLVEQHRGGAEHAAGGDDMIARFAAAPYRWPGWRPSRRRWRHSTRRPPWPPDVARRRARWGW